MKPRITLITLGVGDLERSLRFYRDGLGLKTRASSARSSSTVPSPFSISRPVSSSPSGEESIAHDTSLPVSPSSATEFTIGHNVSSKQRSRCGDGAGEEGRRDDREARHDTFWGGYSGYFQDPDSASLGGRLEPPMDRAGLSGRAGFSTSGSYFLYSQHATLRVPDNSKFSG